MSTLMSILTTRIAAEILADDENEREQKWLTMIKRTEPQEEKMKPALRAAFTKQENAVQGKLRRVAVPVIEKSEKVARVGDNIVFKHPNHFSWEGYGVIKTVFQQTVEVEIYEKLTHTLIVPLRHIVLLKGSDEAEAASEAYVDAIYTASQWQTIFETMALPFVTVAYKTAGEAAYTEIGLEAAFNVTNPRARKYLKDKVFKFSEEVNATTREKIRKALVKGLDAGEGIPEISKRIAGVFDINRGSRTDKIARTEIVGASNNGTHAGYVESKIVLTEIWIDSRDASVRTSPHNHALDGEEVKLGSRFSNGLLHPHDPGGAAGNVIQCRCTSAAGKLKEAA